MKSYKNFLIVSDMDGTLINSNNMITEKNRAAISRFVEQGGSFAIATGRTPANVQQFMAGLMVNTPCIFFNGSMLYDMQSKQVLEIRELKGMVWRSFAAVCLKNFPTACIEVYTEDKCYIVSDEQYDDPRLKAEFTSYEHTGIADIAAQKWLKFFICAEKKILEQVRELAAREGIDKLSVSFYSSPVYFEFVGKNVSKGDMLEVLRNLPENKGRFVVAAGDFHNDNEMLRRADCGVAPANAELVTKKAADRIGVSCDESLLAYIIDEIIPEYF